MEEPSEEETQNVSEDEEEDKEEESNEIGGRKKKGDEELDEVPIQKILELFEKDQLIVLLNEAVSKFPEIFESMQRLADLDPAQRKIFVQGIDRDSKRETLISVFSKYGEIDDCQFPYDMVSGNSKGYGFILFKHRSGAIKALKHPQKKIDNRLTSCELASDWSKSSQRTIFVGNLFDDVDPQKLTDFFARYGEIEEGPFGLDRHTGKFKGFCLFKYKSIESYRKALEEPLKRFEGRTLKCQKSKRSRNEKTKYTSASGPALGFNPAVSAPALAPSFVQALAALLTSHGAGFGEPMNQGMPPTMNNPGYGNLVGANMSPIVPNEDQMSSSQNYSELPSIQSPKFFNFPPIENVFQQNQHFSSRKENTNYTSASGPTPGHLPAPSRPALGFNPAVSTPALGPSFGQASTTLLSSQGAGFGATMNRGMPPMMNNPGYGNQVGASYDEQSWLWEPGPPAYINQGQGGYQNPQLGQGSTRSASGGASYLGYRQ